MDDTVVGWTRWPRKFPASSYSHGLWNSVTVESDLRPTEIQKKAADRLPDSAFARIWGLFPFYFGEMQCEDKKTVRRFKNCLREQGEKCCTKKLAERSSGWRSKRAGRARAVVRRERIIGRNYLEGCETNVGKAGLVTAIVQSHLSLWDVFWDLSNPPLIQEKSVSLLYVPISRQTQRDANLNSVDQEMKE